MVKMSQGRLTLPPCFLSRAQNWSFLKGYDPMVRQTTFLSDILALRMFIYSSNVY